MSPVPSPAPRCECGHPESLHVNDDGVCWADDNGSECHCTSFRQAAGSSVPDTSGQPRALYDFEKHRWTGKCPFGTECSGCNEFGYCTEMEESRYGTLADSGGVQAPSSSGLPAVREPDEGVNAAGEQTSGSAAPSGECGPTTASPPAALTSRGVREPDEATIRAALELKTVSGVDWIPVAYRTDALAALDRLVADRDRLRAKLYDTPPGGELTDSEFYGR